MILSKVRGGDLPKFYSFITQLGKEKKRSLYFYKILNGALPIDQEFSCFHDEDNFFLIEDRAGYQIIHGEFDHFQILSELENRITKPGLLRVKEKMSGAITYKAFRKDFIAGPPPGPDHFEKDLKFDETWELFQRGLKPSFMPEKDLELVIKENRYFLRRDEHQKISYLQIYSLEGRRYYGNFLWSNQKGHFILNDFIQSALLVDQIDYYQTHISERNINSIKLHETCGYRHDQDRDFFLLELRPK